MTTIPSSKRLIKFQKKQTVHKACFADIEREVSLLKIQIREAKKDDVGSQSLKKRIMQLRSQIVQLETRPELIIASDICK